MSSFKTIGARIREERKRLGLTQQQFADGLGIGRSALALYETDRTTPDLLFGQRAKANGIDTWYIMNAERGVEASVDLFDWSLFTGIILGIRSWCAKEQVSLPVEKEIAVARVLYKHFCSEGLIDQLVMDDMLRLAA